MNRIVNRILALGPVTRLTQPWRPPSATIADLAKMKMNAAAIADAAIRITKLFGKFWNQIVKIVTREPRRGWRVATAGQVDWPIDPSRTGLPPRAPESRPV